MSKAIVVDGIGKSFRIPHAGHGATLRSRILHPFSRTTWEEFDALHDVSFDVEVGEFFGIIGRNGSGKSTLLKLMAGIYRPDSGRLAVNGTVAPFIELGVGFNPDLSGRDNVFINGALLGLTPRRLSERYDAIVEFAELERFMDLKLRNFSSGMQVRLAFSIALEAGADILLTDEVLAVGDARFQQKCFDVFRQRKSEGRTVVFVSHDMSAMIDFCDRSVLLDQGRVDMIGDTRAIVQRYQQLEATAVRDSGSENDSPGVPDSAGPCNDRGGPRRRRGQPAADRTGPADPGARSCTVQGRRRGSDLRARVARPARQAGVRDQHHVADQPVGPRRAGDEAQVRFVVDNPLAAGTYRVTCGIVDGDPSHRLDLRNDAAQFIVTADMATGGVVDLPTRVTIDEGVGTAT